MLDERGHNKEAGRRGGGDLQRCQQSRSSEALGGGVDQLDEGLPPAQLLLDAAALGLGGLAVPCYSVNAGIQTPLHLVLQQQQHYLFQVAQVTRGGGEGGSQEGHF